MLTKRKKNFIVYFDFCEDFFQFLKNIYLCLKNNFPNIESQAIDEKKRICLDFN